MSRSRIAQIALLALVGLLCSACATAAGEAGGAGRRGSTLAAARPVPASVTATPSGAPLITAPVPSATPRARTVTDQPWVSFARVGGVTLSHPSARVERVAFHESNHDGARQLEPLATAVDPMTLETRDRGTGSRTAADVVVDPASEIRAPVTGTVKRAGSYVLYCDYSDDFVVVEPDVHPGWEVKVLHIEGVTVRAGDRVTARETVLAPRPAKLPFESQVDESSVAPAWPHVHMEVVDPAIPDRPTPGGGCN